MAAQPLCSERDGNPRSIEAARSFVKYVESLFMPWDIDALVDGFTEDCVVRFGALPAFGGREPLREFFSARRAKQKNYRLRKELRARTDEILTNVWEGEWEDAETGAPMKGFGVETWVMREGKIAVWEAAFNVARADCKTSVEDLLR